jgi:16S rRNA (uracil1498-N3)-methyltransferase
MRRPVLLNTLALLPKVGSMVRLFTPQPLVEGSVVTLSEVQRHYLSSVMRRREGGSVAVFNGVDGEFSAKIEALDRRRCSLSVRTLLRPQPPTPTRPALLFGVIKGAKLPLLVEKATELGVGEIVPVITQHCSDARRSLNLDRLRAIAAEAAEQSGRMDLPALAEPRALADVLSTWDRPLCVCDERGGGVPLSSAGVGPDAGILVGPEGGFSPAEFEALASRSPGPTLVSLGAATLRTETAALAALAILGCPPAT